jgi:hypothetical protein
LPQPTLTTEETPYGLCHCGCGAKAPIAKVTKKDAGWVKGEPKRYLVGHNTRNSPVEYIVDPETGCWVWQRSFRGNGYGAAYHDGRQTQAHRMVYERHRGTIRVGLVLDHLCRNSMCVNPAHLEAVTPAENNRRGVRAKLTLTDVEEIRTRSDSAAALALKYSVTKRTIYNIWNGQTWAPDPEPGQGLGWRNLA